MISIPGISYMNPGVVSEGSIVSAGTGLPSSNRILCIVGEGARREVIVSFAEGNGSDGWDPTYTSTTTNTDGRHFALQNYPVQTNRTKLYKNGVLLLGKEETLSSVPLSPLYDYRLELTTGRIELAPAHLVDQGGAYYLAYGANVGNGTITNLTLIDTNAPSETWTIRCSSVRRDVFGNPIDGYGRFTAIGSVSGLVLDGYGAPVIWQSDGTIRNNGILRFQINEGSTVFDVGDTFTIEVESGVLRAGDNLIAEYIAVLDINDPELFTDGDSVAMRYGVASTTNTVTLGSQLAFANGTPGVLCLQAAPAVPRRTWYRVVDEASGNSNPDDLKFILPVGVNPDSNSEVKFLIVDTTTDVETQILPNKVDFYDPVITAAPDDFINLGDPYSYTVVKETFVVQESEDLVITAIAGGPPYYATITSPTITFGFADYSATITIHIYDATNPSNNGTFIVTNVAGGALTIRQNALAFVTETDVRFRELDTSQTDSSYILFTHDLALTSSQGLSAGVIDARDSSFYDANWSSAFEKLEASELDILCPFPTQTKSAIMQSALQHCLNMSRIKNRKERVLFTGAIQLLLPDNVTGVEPAAVEDIGILEGIQGDDPAEILAGNMEDLTDYSVTNAFGTTYRCVYHYPDRIVVSLSGTNTYIDGMYLGAAHGGLLSATGNVAIPSTNKTLAGFSILRDRTFSTLVAENITRAGITLVEPVLGGGRIIWGKTTSQSGYAEEEEISIVFIRDRIAKLCRLGCQGFIGQVETQTFALSLQARINALCKSFVAQEMITSYRDITVKRDDVDPRQWNVLFGVQPSYPVSWIYIKFELGIL